MSSGITSQEEERAAESVVAPSIQLIESEQQVNQALQQSRASSSSGSSTRELHFEGGQEENKDVQAQPITQAPIQQAPFRPPMNRPPAPMAGGMGRGRGAPQFRPPVGNAQPRPRPNIPQFGGPRMQPPVAQIEEQPTQIQEVIQEEQKIEQPAPLIEQPKIIQKVEAISQPKKEDNPKPEERAEPIKEIKPQEEIKEEPIASKKPEEETKQTVVNTQPSTGQSLIDFKNNRFFGMINGFISILTRRKKAYTGKASSAMYYDEKKKRYVFEGEEDESDDDVPPPPPPKRQPVEDAKAAEKPAENVAQKEQSALESLTRPAFSGALANRGRGRGRGAPLNRFPQLLNPSQLSTTTYVPRIEEQEQRPSLPVQDPSRFEDATKENIQNEAVIQDQQHEQENLEMDERYVTGIDLTVNQTRFELANNTIINQTVLMAEQQEIESPAIIHDSQLIQQQLPHATQQHNRELQTLDPQRESQWLAKFSLQQDKITNLKYRVQMLQQELRSERDQNEQTIESFTVMCQDLKFKGMDEVEDLQSELAIAREQMRTLSHIRAQKEIKIEQLSEQVRAQEEENLEMREQIREMRFLKMQEEIDREIERAAERMQESSGLEEHEREEEQEVNGLKQMVLSQQIDLDNFKWRVTVLEAEKLAKVLDCRDLQILLDRTKAQLTFSESETSRLQEDLRRIHQEQIQYGQEQMAKVERERDQIREAFTRTQQERDRLNDTLREKVQEFEIKSKRQESDRQRSDLDHSRQIREKDSQVEFLKSQILSHQHQHSQQQEESKHLHTQVRDLQTKLQQLQAKRQSESEQAEHILKLQLKQTQEMLESRNQEALKKKEEEMSMELQQMDAMRHKLTENIVYLQNEIRKRDDLLENSSEFGGEFEMVGDEYDDESSMNGGVNEDGGMENGSHQNDSQRDSSQKYANASQRQESFQIVKRNTNKRRTQYQALQSQLEDSRLSLMREIEQRLNSERSLQNVQHLFRKVMEGVFDINKVIDSQHQQFLTEQAEPDFDGDEQSKQLLDQDDSDTHIQAIISKIFALQRGYETELSECKHKITMQQMKLEEFDSLKFDLEIVQDEKSLLESDLSEVNEHVKDLESKLQQAQTQAYEQQYEVQNMRERLEISERTRDTQRQQYEEQVINMNNEAQRQIDEIHDSFKQQMIPAVKQKYQAKLEELQDQFNSMKNLLTQQLDEEKRHSQELEKQNMNLLSQTQGQLEQNTLETERLRDQLKLQDQESTNLQEQLAQLQLSSRQQLEHQSTEINSLRQELDDLQSQHKQETDKLVWDFDQVCAKLKERYEQKSLKVKEAKDKMRAALEMMREQCTQESQLKIDEIQRELDRAREAQASAVNKEALEELEGQIRQRDEQIQVLQGELEAAEILKQQVEQLNQHNAELEYQLQQSQIQDEHQANLVQLSAENERLTLENQQLQDSIESLNGYVNKLQSDLNLAQQKNEQINLEDIQPNFDQKELESTIATLKEELRSLTQSHEALKTDIAQQQSDFQSRVDSLTSEKDQQLQQTVDNYTQGLEQLKSQTKEIVKDLKEKIKKEKESGLSKVSEVQNELAKCQADKKDLERKVLELKNLYNQALSNQDQTDMIQGLKNQNEDLIRQVMDLQTQTADLNAKLQQALSNLSAVEDQLVPLQSQRDSLLDQLDQLQQSFDTLVDQLAVILGIEEYGEPTEIIDKLQLLMQNYEEDKRSLKVMIDEKEHLTQLSEQYYNEKESVILDKTNLQNKFETSNAGKLEKKLRTLEEENSVMKSDFYIRINSFVEEIDQLKSKLSQYEVVVENPNEESKEEPSSFTSTAKPVDQTMTQAPAERPSFAESQIHKPVDSSNIQQRSGIFNSIASFFLTESEMHHEGQQK